MTELDLRNYLRRAGWKDPEINALFLLKTKAGVVAAIGSEAEPRRREVVQWIIEHNEIRI